MAILSEAYSNAPFAKRIRSTYNFTLEILRFAASKAKTIKQINRAGSARPDSVAVRADYAPPFNDEVIAEITETDGEGSHGFARRRRSGKFKSIKMPVYGWFQSTHSEPRRPGYLIPAGHTNVIENLRRQGIAVSQLRRPWSGEVEAFGIDSAVPGRQFEQQRLGSVKGSYHRRVATADSGWYVVSTDQRLGTLAVILLEPMSQDGLVIWNFFEDRFQAGTEYPIFRLLDLPKALIAVE